MTATTVPPSLLGVAEVATLLGVAEETLRFWRHQGKGPRSAKFGRRVVYRETDVLAWMDAQFDKSVGDDLADAGAPSDQAN